MAFADLSFTAALWRGRGLGWLTASADLPPGLSLTQEAAPPAAAPAARSGRPASPPASRAARQPRPAARQEQEGPPPHAGAPAGASARWRPLAADALPHAWQKRLAATRPGLVAWTYWNLTQDLSAAGGSAGEEDAGGEARSARRAFLGRLLRELAHPAGTHTFWPACMPGAARADAAGGDAPDFAAHPEAFWSGAAHLGCRAVIVMGSAAVRALGLPGTARPLSQLRWRGQHVLVLWEVDSLAQDAARFGPTLAFLRQALGPVTTPRR